MPYVPVAQNFSGHGLQCRVGIGGLEFRDHCFALLLLTHEEGEFGTPIAVLTVRPDWQSAAQRPAEE
jgi:hypothetical protein